tara:strand:- start:432 stop:662 length:231 start_codon:yes stop_codon:yes gene_type:complete
MKDINDIINTMVDNYYKDQKIIDTNEDSDQTYDLDEDLEAERLSGLRDQHEDEGLCTCGELLDACPDAYEHLSSGV